MDYIIQYFFFFFYGLFFLFFALRSKKKTHDGIWILRQRLVLYQCKRLNKRYRPRKSYNMSSISKKSSKKVKNYSHCVFCGKPILINDYTTNPKLYSHNAEPLAEGYCCGECNATKVIPHRMMYGRGASNHLQSSERLLGFMLRDMKVFTKEHPLIIAQKA